MIRMTLLDRVNKKIFEKEFELPKAIQMIRKIKHGHKLFIINIECDTTEENEEITRVL